MYVPLFGKAFRCQLCIEFNVICALSYRTVHIRGASKKFVDFVNKIKSADAIYLKLPYVCSQFNMNRQIS